MIIESVMNLFKSFILFVIGLFPTLPDSSSLYGFLEPLKSVFSVADMFIDVRVVMTCFLITLLVYNVKFIWSVVMWVIRKIPLGVS